MRTFFKVKMYAEHKYFVIFDFEKNIDKNIKNALGGKTGQPSGGSNFTSKNKHPNLMVFRILSPEEKTSVKGNFTRD